MADLKKFRTAPSLLDRGTSGSLEFSRMREEERNHPIEQVGSKVREMMVWVDGKRKEPVKS